MRIMLIVSLALALLFARGVGGASHEEYVPLYNDDVPPGATPLMDEYLLARDARTVQDAIANWKGFISANAPIEARGFEDVTHLTLARRAHYELARSLYIVGDIAAGDELMRRVDEMVVYEIPEKQAVAKWCCLQGYCRPR